MAGDLGKFHNRRGRPSANMSSVLFNAIWQKFNYVQALSLMALMLVYYGERSYPYSAISRCQWAQNIEEPRTTMTLVADPQLVDENTYPGRGKLGLGITKYIVDYYLRRNWLYMNDVLKPEYNFFLGDLFDGGREWGDDVWEREYLRWNRTFTPVGNAKNYLNLPGNHDIGFGDTIIPNALLRFKKHFGQTNMAVDIGNYVVVILDTISMLNTKDPTIYKAPYDFLDKIGPPNKARILLTHVPLYRSDSSACGSLRESKKNIGYTKGYQYATQVDPKTTDFILKSVQPIMVFSGDDHDACHTLHKYTSTDGSEKKVDEMTVKSFSMAMGIKKPAIQLLTLSNATLKIKTNICLMPSPFLAFICYGCFAVCALALVITYNFYPHVLPEFMNAFQYRVVGDTGGPLPVYEGISAKAPRRRARRSVKRVVNEASLIAGTFLSFYLFLGWSIYW